MESFLEGISYHEENNLKILSRFNNLKTILNDTIIIEQKINKLSSNQQIINVSDYVDIYTNVKKIIRYFEISNLLNSQDYISNMIILMNKAFKTYEETFYSLLKKYNAILYTQTNKVLDINNINNFKNNTNSDIIKIKNTNDDNISNFNDYNNDRKNILNKLQSLAVCLSDEGFDYPFTNKLITERSNNIIEKLEHIKINFSKKTNFSSDINEKHTSLLSILLISLVEYIIYEKEFISSIFDKCSSSLSKAILTILANKPIEFLIEYLNESNSKNFSNNNFFNLIDFINSWKEDCSLTIIALFKSDINNKSSKINSLINKINSIEEMCIEYIINFQYNIVHLTDKIENENIISSTSHVSQFISKIIKFNKVYKEFSDISNDASYNTNNIISSSKINEDFFNKTENKPITNFNVNNIINTYIKSLESKSLALEKSYAPLRWIFLINNVYYLYSRIKDNSELKNIYNSLDINNSESHENIYKKITDEYVSSYLNSCWKKTVIDIDKISIEYKNESSKLIKNSTKDFIKKIFINFYNIITTHSNIQRQIYIINKNIENLLINNNKKLLVDKYKKVLDVYSKLVKENTNNTISKKYIKYSSSNDFQVELELFFSCSITNKK